MKKLDNNFSYWVHLARMRAEITLMDGRLATLVAVRKPSRNCKIKLLNRHYMIWIDDIALVKEPETDQWIRLDAWPAVDLDTRPGVKVTSLADAAASRHWLKVVPNPSVLHPSFQPPSRVARPAAPTSPASPSS